jgi:hypothetical protein
MTEMEKGKILYAKKKIMKSFEFYHILWPRRLTKYLKVSDVEVVVAF